jgi:argininosuccinate synthase
MKKVVLAYSGGLDTSVAIRWLKDRGYSVIAYMADVGQGGEVAGARKRAMKAGAAAVVVDDLKKEFAEDFAFQSLKAGAVYEGKYYLATALSRPIIAKGLVKTAKARGAQAVSHGCTGKGNDQVRFEVTIGALDSRLEVIAPVREWEFPSRESQIRYALANKIPINVTKKSPYSIDKNLWGMSIECGRLEDPWAEPPKDIYQMTKDPQKAPKRPKYITIEFKKGTPAAINGKPAAALDLIKKLNDAGGEYGIGRADMVENRLVGIKSREIYEAPAAEILFNAHQALESLVLDRELSHFKAGVSLKYAELIYYGLWYTPLREALDSFIGYTQKKVSGSVKVKLEPGKATVVGRKSPHSLYKEELATYSEKDKFDQALAKGFIELWGLPYKK